MRKNRFVEMKMVTFILDILTLRCLWNFYWFRSPIAAETGTLNRGTDLGIINIFESVFMCVYIFLPLSL